MENWRKNWKIREFEEALKHDIIISNTSNNYQENLEENKLQYLHAEGLSLVGIKVFQ